MPEVAPLLRGIDPVQQIATWNSTPEKARERNWFLWGPTGTGKSFLCRCEINKALDNGEDVAETTAFALVHEGLRFGGENRFDALCRVKWLLLDDIDKAPWDRRSLSVLWTLLDAREHFGHTLVTANIGPDTLSASMGEIMTENQAYHQAIFERLRPCMVIEFTGESLRQKGA